MKGAASEKANATPLSNPRRKRADPGGSDDESSDRGPGSERRRRRRETKVSVSVCHDSDKNPKRGRAKDSDGKQERDGKEVAAGGGGGGGNDTSAKLERESSEAAAAVAESATANDGRKDSPHWSTLPADVETLVFEFTAPRDRLVAIERVCRCWRDESRHGAGWTTAFDASSAAWRDFVRIAKGASDADTNKTAVAATFAEYLGRLGQPIGPMSTGRLSRIETFSNRCVAYGTLQRPDEALVALALASPLLRSVDLVADDRFRFGPPLALAASRIADRLTLSRASQPRRPVDASLGDLFAALRVSTLVLERIEAPPDAYRRLAAGPAYATLTDLAICYAGVPAHHLDYVGGLAALQTLRLSNLTCAELPTRVAATLRTLVCDRVVFLPSCWSADRRRSDGDGDATPADRRAWQGDDDDDTDQPFRTLEAFTMSDADDPRFYCSVLRTNAATLRRLHVLHLWRLVWRRTVGRLYETLGACRFPALTSLGVSGSGLEGAWDAIQPLLRQRIGGLSQLLLCDLALEDTALAKLARIFNGDRTDEVRDVTPMTPQHDVDGGGGSDASIGVDGRDRKAATKRVLPLRSLTLANNFGVTASGVLDFVCATELPHLALLDVGQVTSLVFATGERVLRARLPVLKRFLAAV